MAKALKRGTHLGKIGHILGPGVWAVDLRQSHEIPKAWIENTCDLNSEHKKKQPNFLLLQRQGYVWKTETQERTVRTEKIS